MAEKEVKSLKFIWKIENYNYSWNKKGDFLQSPVFPMDVFEGSSWCLKLYPRGVSSYEKYVSIYLERLESSWGPHGITLDCEIGLLKLDGANENVKEMKDRIFRKGHSFGFDNLALREEIFGVKKSTLLPEDILTIQCCIFPKGTELKSYTEITAKTHIELERSVFLWKSKNVFTNACYDYMKWSSCNKKLNAEFKFMWPTGILKMCYIGCSSLQIMHIKLGILDSNYSISKVLVDELIDGSRNVDLINKHELMKQKSLYLPNDELTLHCDITFAFGVHHSQIEMKVIDKASAFVTFNEKESPEIDMPLKNHSCSCINDYISFKNDLQSLYQEGTLCDFTLKVGNENIEVHKAVLGARSPVFKAMLTSNMKENEKNRVDITDLDVITVRRMLTFIYTDTTGDLDWETARKLYFAADKYGIMKLKSICSGFLEKNLCVSNVGEALSLANLHGDDDFKNIILEFISNHDTKVICSTEWKAFMTEEMHLAAEIMRYIFMKKAENDKGQT